VTDRPDTPPHTAPRPDPRPEDAVLDLLMGELEPAARTELEARLAREPALAALRAGLVHLLEAERLAFEPPLPGEVWDADAARMAARVRAAAAPRRRPVRAGAARGQRSWARVLAFSVALHVVALGVLAFVVAGRDGAPPAATGRLAFDAEALRPLEPDYAQTEIAMRWDDLDLEDLGQLSDRVVSAEQDTIADELPEDGASRAPVERGMALDHPLHVVVPMSRRRIETLKRRRLHLLGYNAHGTMRAVEKGLRYLRSEQREDGAFPPGGGRGALEQTALTMLAFLADGHCTHHAAGESSGRAVARGVGWLRQDLFGAAAPEIDARPADELGLPTIALCEDYMLSYGRLTPAEALVRGNEIAALVNRLRASPAAAPVAAPWRTWAIDAAARAGVIRPTAEDRRAFSAWRMAAAEANGTLSERDAFGALAVSTALLYTERAADKPRFLAWSRAHAGSLVDRLDPIGKARSGDPVGATAGVLLALQVAYRTY
jgi:hypothetical protein